MGITNILGEKYCLRLIKRTHKSFPYLAKHLPAILGESTTRQYKNQKAIGESKNNLIPNTIYQTWESNKFGKTWINQIEKFQQLNSNFNFKFFDTLQRNEYMDNIWSKQNPEIFKIYNNAQFGSMKVDIFRYCLIYDLGGYYFDINKALTVNIDDVIEVDDTGFITYVPVYSSWMPPKNTHSKILFPEFEIGQWTFGFTPKHKALEFVINDICENADYFNNKVYDNPKDVLWLITLKAFDRGVKTYLGMKNNLKIQQTKVSFNNKSKLLLPGAWVRYAQHPSYVWAKNKPVLVSK